MLPQKIGMLDLGERSECTDLGALFGLPDPFEFGDVTDVKNVLRLEELLLHGGDKIGASGPLPSKHNAPPCSRKRIGAIGSTPSVRLRLFSDLCVRSAASTRSGVNGASCKRIPTAS